MMTQIFVTIWHQWVKEHIWISIIPASDFNKIQDTPHYHWMPLMSLRQLLPGHWLNGAHFTWTHSWAQQSPTNCKTTQINGNIVCNGQHSFRTFQVLTGNKCDHTNALNKFRFNLLLPSDAMGCHRSLSALVQEMAWCLRAPSHYLNQCWLLVNGTLMNQLIQNFNQNTNIFKKMHL